MEPDLHPTAAEPSALRPEGRAAASPGRVGTPTAPTIFGTAAYLLGGVAAIVLGSTGLAHSDAMIARVLLALAGCVLAYRGIAATGRRCFSPTWDAAFWVSTSWLAVVGLSALLAPVLPIGEASNSAATLDAPVYARPDLLSAHPLGTNNLGLDLLARVIYGARVSLTISIGAVVIGLVVGGAVGLIAGYRRGALDSFIGIGTNSLLAFPPLVLLLALAAVLPRSTRNMALALGVLAVPVNVRLARAATLATAQREFVTAARGIGARGRRIVVRELMPNVLPPLLAYGLVIVAVMIVAEASLSFLGLGIQQPQPSWGNMIAEGQGGVFERHPFIVLVPGAALFATVCAFNIVGERIRARFDTRRIEL